MEVQKGKEHYYNNDYDNKGRFISYWHQKDEILRKNPKTVLEIGIGNNFLSDYLRKRKIEVTTLDICDELGPDIKASITSIPVEDNKYELVSCFEVLEHLPYKDFPGALKEIYRVCSRYSIISLPDSNTAISIFLLLPKIKDIRILFSLRRIRPKIHQFDGQHYWEIGKRGYDLKVIISKIKETGFRIVRTYRMHEVPYYRFFILEK